MQHEEPRSREAFGVSRKAQMYQRGNPRLHRVRIREWQAIKPREGASILRIWRCWYSTVALRNRDGLPAAQGSCTAVEWTRSQLDSPQRLWICRPNRLHVTLVHRAAAGRVTPSGSPCSRRGSEEMRLRMSMAGAEVLDLRT